MGWAVGGGGRIFPFTVVLILPLLLDSEFDKKQELPRLDDYLTMSFPSHGNPSLWFLTIISERISCGGEDWKR